MNERADRWSNCKCGAWFKVLGVSVVGFCPYCGAALSAATHNNGTYCIHGIKCALCAEGAYPAGTGQPDEHPNQRDYVTHSCDKHVICEVVRDSVKGEGEAAPPECGVCGAKPGEKGHGADAMGNVHHVPSAPSPEELAREIALAFGITKQDEKEWIAALLRTHMGAERWIPVSERLPEMGQKVLISYGVGPWVWAAEFSYDMGDHPQFGFAGFGQGFAWDVTHWRPLPSAPDAEEKK